MKTEKPIIKRAKHVDDKYVFTHDPIAPWDVVHMSEW